MPPYALITGGNSATVLNVLLFEILLGKFIIEGMVIGLLGSDDPLFCILDSEPTRGILGDI